MSMVCVFVLLSYVHTVSVVTGYKLVLNVTTPCNLRCPLVEAFWSSRLELNNLVG